jgi:hypothetical protein
MARLLRMGRYTAILYGIFSLLLTHSLTYGQTPSALVLEMDGNSTPPLQPYNEIAAGSMISLSDTSQLVFLHYTTCRTVNVIGGIIVFDVNTYTLTGESKRSDMRSPCPRTVRLKAEGETAGAIIRKVPYVSHTFSPQPNFLLVGIRASDFTSIRIFKDDREVLQSPIDGRWFRWPKGVTPLTKGEVYQLNLIPKSGNSAQVITTFTVIGTGLRVASEELMLIRID